MRKEIADLWCDALESGEYIQGKGGLCLNGKYCCLGVLTDLYMKQVGDLKFENLGGRCFYNGWSEILPEEVAEWAGMRTNNGTILILRYYSLTCINDHLKWNFEKISGFIKEHWEKL